MPDRATQLLDPAPLCGPGRELVDLVDLVDVVSPHCVGTVRDSLSSDISFKSDGESPLGAVGIMIHFIHQIHQSRALRRSRADQRPPAPKQIERRAISRTSLTSPTTLGSPVSPLRPRPWSASRQQRRSELLHLGRSARYARARERRSDLHRQRKRRGCWRWWRRNGGPARPLSAELLCQGPGRPHR
jgi:hypothetical protein